ncbi:MAG: YfhO family protein, partial [Rikenellaceae bacterium]|nr:YfhO family protein [Rikenellaceae bacterium]
YFLFVIAAYWINELAGAVKNKTLPHFAKVTGLLVIAATMAAGANTAKLWYVNESGKYSIRGGSELSSAGNEGTGGLDLEYATHWSYGKMESFNLFIPNYAGGSDQGGFSNDGPVADALSRYGARQLAPQLPGYWGPQPSTVGPTYLGAVMVYLFVLGMILLRGRDKWWIFGVSVLALLLAWGRNFMPLTELFFNYFPGYNKFRTVSMILAVVEWTVPLLAALALANIWRGDSDRKRVIKGIQTAFYITGGIALFFLVVGGIFDFTSVRDTYYGLPDDVLQAMRTERASMLRRDCVRSLLFAALTGGTLWLFAAGKIKKWLLVSALAALVLFDMVPVNLRYLPRSRFVEKSRTEIRPTAANLEIMADPELGFRVLDISSGNISGAFNDARASYFHRSVGGYHGAKMQRYQDIIEHHIYRGNMEVIDMLDTKYIIQPDGEGQPVATLNPGANGAAWLVEAVVVVDTPDQEIEALNHIDTKTTAVVDGRFADLLPGLDYTVDSTARIDLTEYRGNYLRYEYRSVEPSLAVFSEIYYDKGWTAYLDGVEHPYIRADYILRAMALPAGSHTVEFRYRAEKFDGLYISSVIFSILILIAVAAAAAAAILCNRKRKCNEPEQTA